jgi:hypothetical protein
LDRKLGFWLDYWLFLHAEDTHPIWSNRPLGIADIAEAALAAGSHEAKLSQQLKREIHALRRLVEYLPDLPPMPSTSLGTDELLSENYWLKVTHTAPLDHYWVDWLNATRKLISHDTFTAPLTRATAHALVTHDYETAAFLTRRLAAELSASELSVNRLFLVAKSELCDSGNYDNEALDESDLDNALRQALLPPVPKNYEIEIPLAPVPISSRVARIAFTAFKLITDHSGPSGILKGISTQLEATHAEEAAGLAVKAVRKTLESLRLRFYIQTHLIGTVKVRDPQGSETEFSLPQPFWSMDFYRRAVPRLPKKFNVVVKALPLDEHEGWNAARWHVSQAFSAWAEDAHAAASHVWQGLESFERGRGGLGNVLRLGQKYVGYATTEMAKFLAMQVSGQAKEFADSGEMPDWYYWDGKLDINKWLWRVLHKNSHWRYTWWKNPQAPQFLFDHRVGAIQIVSRKLRGKNENWMEKRLAADLWLLYGIRNRVVHSGERALPWQMAMHLGQLGAELIFTLMQGRVATLRMPIVEPKPPHLAGSLQVQTSGQNPYSHATPRNTASS